MINFIVKFACLMLINYIGREISDTHFSGVVTILVGVIFLASTKAVPVVQGEQK